MNQAKQVGGPPVGGPNRTDLKPKVRRRASAAAGPDLTSVLGFGALACVLLTTGEVAACGQSPGSDVTLFIRPGHPLAATHGPNYCTVDSYFGQVGTILQVPTTLVDGPEADPNTSKRLVFPKPMTPESFLLFAGLEDWDPGIVRCDAAERAYLKYVTANPEGTSQILVGDAATYEAIKARIEQNKEPYLAQKEAESAARRELHAKMAAAALGVASISVLYAVGQSSSRSPEGLAGKG